MPTVHIDGFLPDDTSTLIHLYDAATFGTSAPRVLWAGSPDRTGSVRCKLGRSMVGESIQLVAVGGKAKYYGARLPVSRLGVFHTANLELDRVLHNGQNPFTTEFRCAAEERVLASHREARYKNYLLSVVFAVATIFSVYVGLVIPGILGLAVGALLTLTSLFLGNYASGWSRGV